MNEILINKNNLLYNLKSIKQLSNKKICAVVKSNAYGNGLNLVVNALKGKVDYLAVTNLNEALSVRNIDKTTPVIVLFDCQNYQIALKNNICVSVYNINQAKEIAKKKFDNKLKVHLKINCGMNRIGISSIKELKNILFTLKNNCIIEGIYTHYSCINTDIPKYKKEMQKFDNFIIYAKKYYPNILVHTGGSLDFQNTQSDMLRTGLFLYGYGYRFLKPVMSIYSEIIQINRLNTGQSCGYNNEFIAKEDCFIATLPIGYQDGFKKCFKNHFVVCNHIFCPIVSICMDCMMIKVPKNTKQKEKVCVFYNADLYSDCFTNYEILTNFNSCRGKRKFKNQN